MPRRRPARPLLTLCMIILMATAARADSAEEPPVDRETHAGAALVQGAVAGVAGFAAGALMGAGFSDDDDVYDGLESRVIGGSIAGGLCLPLGVHKGNRGQGNGAMVMATSVLGAGVGWGLALATSDGAFVVATPIIQLLACTAVEVATTPAGVRAPASQQSAVAAAPRSWSVSVAPALVDRQPGVVLSGAF